MKFKPLTMSSKAYPVGLLFITQNSLPFTHSLVFIIFLNSASPLYFLCFCLQCLFPRSSQTQIQVHIQSLQGFATTSLKEHLQLLYAPGLELWLMFFLAHVISYNYLFMCLSYSDIIIISSLYSRNMEQYLLEKYHL